MTSGGYKKDLIRIQTENFLQNGQVNAFSGMEVA